jgi:hypothetical protein
VNERPPDPTTRPHRQHPAPSTPNDQFRAPQPLNAENTVVEQIGGYLRV